MPASPKVTRPVFRKSTAATKVLTAPFSVIVPLFAVVAPIALRPLAANPVARFLYHWRWPLVALWFTAVALAILVRFWDYWSTLI